MTTDLIPDEIQFAENPEPRCPCVLVVDVSTSMLGERMDELNAGIATFSQELNGDPLASLRTEVAIVTFGVLAEVAQDFVTVDRFEAPTLVANGTTSMSAGIHLALDKIEERKKSYNDNGIDYYRPWLFLITDGEPTELPAEVEIASARLRDAQENKSVAAFFVGVEGANLEKLAQISPTKPLLLKGLEFSSMFVWLSQSMSRVSASQAGDAVTLDTDGLQDWAAI